MTFTPQEFIVMVLGSCGAIVAIAVAWGGLARARRNASFLRGVVICRWCQHAFRGPVLEDGTIRCPHCNAVNLAERNGKLG